MNRNIGLAGVSFTLIAAAVAFANSAVLVGSLAVLAAALSGYAVAKAKA